MHIEKYIRPGDRVLEIGAGTGRYSNALARQGYTVDAVELVEHNIDVFRKNIQSNESITVTQGNAMDLSAFQDNEYDITLLLGPLYATGSMRGDSCNKTGRRNFCRVCYIRWLST